MDLLFEKGGKRTYLSRYKVITTSFEESSPSVKRNNTQIQYRNGNVDFGGWNEAKTIDYVGYYRADDLEDEEYLRERIYALLSDPEGYYITQLKNDNDNSFERPGETSGDYFDKQVNRPSHKRFYVYASSLESELVGSYGGHVLYKISATFTTMKLPYGESIPRDLDVKTNVPYYGENLLANTSNDYTNVSANGWGLSNSVKPIVTTNGGTYTASVYVNNTSKADIWLQVWINGRSNAIAGNKVLAGQEGLSKATFTLPNWQSLKDMGCAYTAKQTETMSYQFKQMKLENGTTATPWNPAPSDQEYNKWYLDTYYNTKKLVIPYAGTVPCSQLEQGFIVEFIARQSGGGVTLNLNGTKLTYSGSIVSGDVLNFSGYEYTKNGISVVNNTNKAYFKLIPEVKNEISCSIAGTIKILGYQDLYA